MAGVFLYISLGNMLPEVEASLKEFREQNNKWTPMMCGKEYKFLRINFF